MLTIVAPGISSEKEPLQACVYSKHEIEGVWDLLEPFFQRSIDVSNGRLTMRWLQQGLLLGAIVAFATYRKDKLEMVLAVEMANYPGMDVARIVAIAGKNLKEASRFLDALETWALSQGAVEIEGFCRPAMVRLARHFGWKPQVLIVTKDLRRRLQ